MIFWVLNRNDSPGIFVRDFLIAMDTKQVVNSQIGGRLGLRNILVRTGLRTGS